LLFSAAPKIKRGEKMLKEKAAKYYSEDNDLNCAESMLYAANEAYALGLDRKGLDTMASFGGGMAVEGVCGALTGGLAALGVMFTGDKSLDSKTRREIVTAFYEAFEERLGCDHCKRIKEAFRDDTFGCREVVKHSAEILEKVIQKYRSGTV